MARKKARLAGGGRAAGGIPDDVFEVGKGGKSAQKVKIKVDFSFHLKIGKNQAKIGRFLPFLQDSTGEKKSLLLRALVLFTEITTLYASEDV